MLLATGQGQYADLIERTLFNGFLSGIALDGERFFYVNPLLSNGLGEVIGRGGHERRPWYLVACCPPNVMRLLGSLPQYCASSDARGVQLHQYVAGSVSVGAVELRLDTEYPWQGAVALTVERTAAEPWTLSLRRPGWCAVATVVCNGSSVEPPLVDGYWQLDRTWQVGDRVELTLEMPVRLTRAHPRVEACAGQVAVERGPIVYCFEQCDQRRQARPRPRPRTDPGRNNCPRRRRPRPRPRRRTAPSRCAASRTTPGPTAHPAPCASGSR